MHETGCSGLMHWDDPEGWDGKGGGRGFRMGNTCIPVTDSCQCMAKPPQYCKVISLQLKKKKTQRQKKDISRQTQTEGIFAYKFSLKAMLIFNSFSPVIVV